MAFPTLFSNDRVLCCIYTQLAGGEYPIHGAYKAGNKWIPTVWTQDGYHKSERQLTGLDINHGLKTLNDNKEKKSA